jgi:hypothetical protein
MPNIFALTTRGLEAISAAEIAAFPGVTLGETGYRRVSAASDALAPLLGLRTVDDVYLDLGKSRCFRSRRASSADGISAATRSSRRSAKGSRRSTYGDMCRMIG